MKRGDYIRTMTDEQLAIVFAKAQMNALEMAEKSFISILIKNGMIDEEDANDIPGLPGLEDFKNEWLEWLQKELAS